MIAEEDDADRTSCPRLPDVLCCCCCWSIIEGEAPNSACSDAGGVDPVEPSGPVGVGRDAMGDGDTPLNENGERL
jgi:hypothetical protein